MTFAEVRRLGSPWINSCSPKIWKSPTEVIFIWAFSRFWILDMRFLLFVNRLTVLKHVKYFLGSIPAFSVMKVFSL